MFNLTLRLSTGPCSYLGDNWFSGVRALDYRRYHGIPDGTTVPVANTYCGAGDLKFGLPESVAREILPADATDLLIQVHPDDCAAGEIVLGWYYGGRAKSQSGSDTPSLLLSETITLTRALELRRVSTLRRRAVEAESALKDARQEAAALLRQLESVQEMVEAD